MIFLAFLITCDEKMEEREREHTTLSNLILSRVVVLPYQTRMENVRMLSNVDL